MNRIYHDVMLDEFKTKASLLLKASRANDALALQRLNMLGRTRPAGWKLKDALLAIAQDNGFETWAKLKTFVENPFEQKMTSRYLNHWFADYDEASEYRAANGGYLLPFKGQFFVCESYFIEGLGLNPQDPAWQEIGFDWVKPQNPKALFRLYEQLIKQRKK